MPKAVKTAAELEALVLDGLRVQAIDAAAIEVYAIEAPELAMNWTVRRLRLNKTAEVKVEGVLKRVVFALLEEFDLAADEGCAHGRGV